MKQEMFDDPFSFIPAQQQLLVLLVERNVSPPPDEQQDDKRQRGGVRAALSPVSAGLTFEAWRSVSEERTENTLW